MHTGQSCDVSKVTNMQRRTQLTSLIDALHTRLNASEPANRSLVSLLNSLAAHLAMHFEMEKSEQSFAEALGQNGRWADEVKRLESERAALLADVNNMIGLARLAFMHKQSAAPLVRGYQEFENRFAQHEAAERELVRKILVADPSLAEN